MALIAVGGIQHETNTFAPTKAGLDAFETGGSRPPLTTLTHILDGLLAIQ